VNFAFTGFFLQVDFTFSNKKAVKFFVRTAVLVRKNLLLNLGNYIFFLSFYEEKTL